MRKYSSDPDIKDIWKRYPVRISGNSVSSCCKQPTLIVQSMGGGFVTRNCPTCGEYSSLPINVFLDELDPWVACPSCRTRMAKRLIDRNYSFACDKCQIYFHLADIVPNWTDIRAL